MNSEDLYNVFSEKVKTMLESTHQEEFLLPENYFEEGRREIILKIRFAGGTEEFETPQGFFEDNATRIFSRIDETSPGTDDFFFSEQRASILAQVHIENVSGGEEFNTPHGFFEKQADTITRRTMGARIRSINWRMWSTAAAAASMIFAIVMLWPAEQKHAAYPTFSYIINQVELDEEDMEYFASDDDYYELYLSEADVEGDTLIDEYLLQENSDTTIVTGPVKLDPKTGLPVKKDADGVKPSNGKTAPTFNELTEEEILRYLLEEGDDDLIN